MSSPLPTTMKVVHQPDPKSTTLVLEDSPLPRASHPEDCIIKMYSATPCLGELHWEKWFSSLFAPDRERVPCTEGAGVIVKLPDAASAESFGFKVGDEVFFRVNPSQTGNLREYSSARLSQMAHKPKNMSWVEAGATPLSSLTAWQGLFQHGTLDSAAILGDEEAAKKNGGIRVLVTGASGVVGSFAVRFAALAGAGHVAAVASGSAAAYVKELGASEVIDYKQQSVAEWAAQHVSGPEVDLVLDCVGGTTLASCWSAVKDGGVLLSVASDPMEMRPGSCDKKLKEAKWFLVEPNGKHLQVISNLIEDGKCKAKVDSTVSFVDYQKAFDKVENKQAKGKVVIQVTG
ncbi:alcohol dehydrogenase [Metarhizium rileyi]|uniref:Alcohol dehydrogenase n=1 Tax=Metarhizium rileyi (strain RCEF 4871) TaxID=1649241 RepID=A0A166WLW6_METRR|nr:alcohol dehydrogenase [Metarhizium rileyi RCEF 4871]